MEYLNNLDLTLQDNTISILSITTLINLLIILKLLFRVEEFHSYKVNLKGMIPLLSPQIFIFKVWKTVTNN